MVWEVWRKKTTDMPGLMLFGWEFTGVTAKTQFGARRKARRLARQTGIRHSYMEEPT